MDATIVESSRRPRTIIEAMTEDRNEEEPSSKVSPVCVNKGYAIQKNRVLLAFHGYEDSIMQKAARGKPLTFFQHLVNRIISAFRYRVEQGMGTLKKHYGFTRMRYLGLSKGNMEFLLNAMAFNLKKAERMIET